MNCGGDGREGLGREEEVKVEREVFKLLERERKRVGEGMEWNGMNEITILEAQVSKVERDCWEQ